MGVFSKVWFDGEFNLIKRLIGIWRVWVIFFRLVRRYGILYRKSVYVLDESNQFSQNCKNLRNWLHRIPMHQCIRLIYSLVQCVYLMHDCLSSNLVSAYTKITWNLFTVCTFFIRESIPSSALMLVLVGILRGQHCRYTLHARAIRGKLSWKVMSSNSISPNGHEKEFWRGDGYKFDNLSINSTALMLQRENKPP